MYGISIVITAILIPFLMHSYDDHLEGQQSFCPFKMLTGMPCPGCGMTKSLVSLYNGELMQSLHYHLFGPLLLAFMVLILFKLIYELFIGKEIMVKYFYSIRLAYIAFALLGCYHIVRVVLFLKTHNLDSILKESIWK